MPTRVYVADFDGATRDRLETMDFGFRLLVAVGTPGAHLLSELEKFQPDVLIIGHTVSLPTYDIPWLKVSLKARWPDLKVILFGGDPADLVENISRLDAHPVPPP